jgi:hypothetical protein
MTMKKIIAATLLLNALLLAQNSFYVSPNGDDANTGTSDKPFATLEKARSAVRDSLENTQGDIAVYLRGGRYVLDETFVLGIDDFLPEHKVTYCAYQNEKAVVSSGILIDDWKKLEDKPVGLPSAALGKVYVADAPKKAGKFRTLYDGFYRLPRARSAGFLPTQAADAKGRSRTELHYPEAAPFDEAVNTDDAEIFIRPWCLWAMNILPIASVDFDKRIAHTAIEGTYPLTRERYERFGPESVWLENTLSVLDSEGEWVFDSKAGKIYLWPARDIEDCRIYVPALTELVAVKGDEQNKTPVRNIVFKGIDFVHGDRDLWTQDDKGLQHDWEMYDKANAMLRFRWAEDCVVDDCGFIGAGSGGVRLDLYAQNITVSNCEISNLGATGILLCGYGPGKKDFNKNNNIINNHIHHIGQLFWQSAAVMVWQSGNNLIANNLVHHTPYNAIVFSGASIQNFKKGVANNFSGRELERTIQVEDCRELIESVDTLTWPVLKPYLHSRDNIFEYNEVHHCIEKLGDGNAVYIRMCPEGNTIRNNYFHDIYGSHDTVTTVLRADDAQDGCKFINNVISECVSGGICSKAGNLIENNIIVDIFTQDDPRNIYKVKPLGYIVNRPSSYAYDDTGYQWHDKTVVTHNVFYSSSKSQPQFYSTLDKNWPKDYYQKIEAIVKAPYYDVNLVYWSGDEDKGYVESRLLEMRKQRGHELRSRAANPRFEDVENGDFRFKPNSPCPRMGIDEVDVRKCGLKAELCRRFEEYGRGLENIPARKTGAVKTEEYQSDHKGTIND